MDLHEETNRFKEWAKNYQGPKSAEWECNYDHWNEYSTSCVNLIDAKAPQDLTAQETAELIYAIARDNEAEHLIDEISKNEDLLFILSEAACNSLENDAKWQFASRLGEVKKDKELAEKLLLRLVNEADEYVSRRALMALSVLGSSQTENYCIKAWDTNHEYQRIAVLTCLKTINSNMLHEYLKEAFEDVPREL